MKYALYPGCVARGACPELFAATLETCRRLGIDLDHETLESASCTGAGVLQERNQKLGDALNARNFALAERAGQPIMTICSTCQGVMSQANKRLKDDPEYLGRSTATSLRRGWSTKGRRTRGTCCGCCSRTWASRSCGRWW